jgi:hypothetical protein
MPADTLVQQVIDELCPGGDEPFVLPKAAITALEGVLREIKSQPHGADEIDNLRAFARWLGETTGSRRTERTLLQLVTKIAPVKLGRGRSGTSSRARRAVS